ncbi:MAG: DNA adenine methylase [Candidatus Zixiibacteriota bacterium]|nr:MAG: DNA adenine methylase [candidate division Zixibacteria bacterium]
MTKSAVSQLALFACDLNTAINVSKVPQRSPFRYPGGKTWLVPRIRAWLQSLKRKPADFIEPFAGGGIVGLTVAFESYADRVTLIEIDDQVAAVWKTMLSRNAGWLANRIETFSLSHEKVRDVIDQQPKSTREKAFQTLLKNRVYHGGILANGSGMLKHGENGKGIASRWYPQTLSRRIQEISSIRERIHFFEEDGMAAIEAHMNRPDVVFFVDPPYTAGGKHAGRRLYRFSDIDHLRLFQLMQNVAGDFLMTYDDAAEVRQMADASGFQVRSVAMTNTHHATVRELLIGRRLDWLQ